MKTLIEIRNPAREDQSLSFYPVGIREADAEFTRRVTELTASQADCELVLVDGSFELKGGSLSGDVLRRQHVSTDAALDAWVRRLSSKDDRTPLRDVPVAYRTREACLACVKRYAEDIKVVPPELRTEEFLDAAVSLNHSVVVYMPAGELSYARLYASMSSMVKVAAFHMAADAPKQVPEETRERALRSLVSAIRDHVEVDEEGKMRYGGCQFSTWPLVASVPVSYLCEALEGTSKLPKLLGLPPRGTSARALLKAALSKLESQSTEHSWSLYDRKHYSRTVLGIVSHMLGMSKASRKEALSALSLQAAALEKMLDKDFAELLGILPEEVRSSLSEARECAAFM